MPPVERIAGPGINPNDLCLDFPAEWNKDEFQKIADTIVRHSLRHASDTLRGMLANTPNAVKLADEFSARLGL